ncbi:hypothetical protein IQ260_03870 [Leptolyngbya cf. ectocarpi LEGE 11479]|uniref:Uncharacterized protein n=1 Tax=Leptolyngbya cf. ectocarpi LEGE 11479 TaxID=1828722 RepID=A0A928ZSU1_LEPEC|nr:hypothetical protein [Leptolyngbya ectocarpi]MBE9065786.1 hypothetical protein [Leptolyngbya cf. ectocarpi LEGE 11479]
MSSSPPSKPTVNFFTSAILLFCGSFGGTHLTAIVAPYSQFNGLVGFLMFPIAFMAGMRLWPWACSVLSNSRSLLKRAKQSKNSAPRGVQRVISSFTFVLTSIAAAGIAGLILTPPSMQVVVDPGYRILIPAGAVYGVLCWLLIQLGYLHHADV